MNRKILLHSGIVSLIALLSYVLFRFLLYPGAKVEISMGYMFFSFISCGLNYGRWIGAYGRTHSNVSERAGMWPHFTENAPAANALCFNYFKWGASIVLFFLLSIL